MSLLLRQTVTGSHHGGFGPVVGVEFEEDIADVIFHRLLTDKKRLCDFTVPLAGGDLLENLDLPVRQLCKQSVINDTLSADTVEFRQHTSGDSGMQAAASFRND